MSKATFYPWFNRFSEGGEQVEDEPRQWRIQKILVGGGLKAKTSKIRMSSPKLRVIFRPKSEIQTFFSPKIRWSPKKKKKKVFTKIETDFSAEISNSNVFFAQNQVVSKKKKNKKKKGLHQNWDWFFGRIRYVLVGGGGCIPKWSRIIQNRGWFFGQNRNF